MLKFRRSPAITSRSSLDLLGEVIYYPSTGERFLSVRAALTVSSIVGVVRREITAVDSNIGVISRTIPEIVEQSLVMERLLARLSGFFGAMALLLASIGLYGLMAYSVARRTKEIGLRVALGAQRAGVVRQILAETLGLTGAGILIGIGAAVLIMRLLQSALFGVRSTDPATLSVATLALVVVAIVSAAIPARRAAWIEPSVALRED
jgi:putative ABC transport system permease protein